MGAHKPKRIGFKLDMTPLVDVAFLLLTFFMFATTMAQPQIMEMQVPPDITTPVEVAQSDLFTLYVSNKEHLFYNTGIDPTMRKIDIKDKEVVGVDRGHVGCLVAVLGSVDGVGVFPQAFRDERCDPPVVFYQQHPHSSILRQFR